MPELSHMFLARCVSVDIEVDPKTARIFGLAAVWREGAKAIASRKGQLDEALDQIEAALSDTSHLIGHNILRHDLPHLIAARPRLAGLVHFPIDTLWLNPLA